MKANITISLPMQVAERIENQRGSLPRSAFISSILESALNSKNGEGQ
jgi:hypothetical protein